MAEARQNTSFQDGLSPVAQSVLELLGRCRVGHGYDLHRLEPIAPHGDGRPLILGGVRLQHDRGPVAHSDGDAVFHAVTDAMLSAIGSPDIGQLFPNDHLSHEGQDSAVFLRAAAERVRSSGLCVVNLDVTVILERPKLGPHKDRMRRAIGAAAGVDPSRIGLKGKTHERVDAVGENRAVEVHVVALLAPSGAAGLAPMGG